MWENRLHEKTCSFFRFHCCHVHKGTLLLGGSSHLKWVIINPSYKWTNPTDPIYNQGYNPLTKWDEPPSNVFYPKLERLPAIDLAAHFLYVVLPNQSNQSKQQDLTRRDSLDFFSNEKTYTALVCFPSLKLGASDILEIYFIGTNSPIGTTQHSQSAEGPQTAAEQLRLPALISRRLVDGDFPV